ncbi:MAG TPA: hypothetical protein DIC42_02000 [Holosporales bacterium]|nr:hypothetical protein [Holosporales bacterium]
MKKIIYFSTLFVGLVGTANATSDIPTNPDRHVTFSDVLSPVPTMSESYDPFAAAPPLFLTAPSNASEEDAAITVISTTPVDDDSVISCIKALFVLPDHLLEPQPTLDDAETEAAASALDAASPEERTLLLEAILEGLTGKESLLFALREQLREAKLDEEEKAAVRTSTPVGEATTESTTYPAALLDAISTTAEDNDEVVEPLKSDSEEEEEEEGMERANTIRDDA